MDSVDILLRITESSKHPFHPSDTWFYPEFDTFMNPVETIFVIHVLTLSFEAVQTSLHFVVLGLVAELFLFLLIHDGPGGVAHELFIAEFAVYTLEFAFKACEFLLKPCSLLFHVDESGKRQYDCGSFDNVCFCIIIHLDRSEEHTSELQSRGHLVCRLLF